MEASRIYFLKIKWQRNIAEMLADILATEEEEYAGLPGNKAWLSQYKRA